MEFFAGAAEQVLVRPGGYVSEAVVPILLRHPAVSRLSPLLTTYVRPAQDRRDSFLLIGIDPILDRPFRAWRISGGETGRRDRWADLIREPHTLILSEPLARELGVAPGGWVDLEHTRGTRAFRVLDTLVPEGLALVEGGRVAITDIATFQEFTGLLGVVDRVDLIFNPGTGPAAARRAGRGPAGDPRAALPVGRARQRHRHDPGVPAEPLGLELRLAVRRHVSGLQPGRAERGLAPPRAGRDAFARGLAPAAVPALPGGGGALRAGRMAGCDPARHAHGALPPAHRQPDHLDPFRAGAAGVAGAQPLGGAPQFRGDRVGVGSGGLAAGARGHGGRAQGGHGDVAERDAGPPIGRAPGAGGARLHRGVRAAVAPARDGGGPAPRLPRDPAALRGVLAARPVDAAGHGAPARARPAARGRGAGLPGRALRLGERDADLGFRGGAHHGGRPVHGAGDHDPQLPAHRRALGPADGQRRSLRHQQDGAGEPVPVPDPGRGRRRPAPPEPRGGPCPEPPLPADARRLPLRVRGARHAELSAARGVRLAEGGPRNGPPDAGARRRGARLGSVRQPHRPLGGGGLQRLDRGLPRGAPRPGDRARLSHRRRHRLLLLGPGSRSASTTPSGAGCASSSRTAPRTWRRRSCGCATRSCGATGTAST